MAMKKIRGSVQKVDLGGQNGYEKDQGYMEWPYVLKNTY